MDVSQQKILVSKEQIAEKVQEMGAQITADYRDKTDKKLVIISILKGAIPFTADLIRSIKLPLQLEAIVASSYGSGTVSSGTVALKYQSFKDLTDCHVILVDDIIDSGYTLQAIGKTIQTFNPASVAYCTFLSKPSRREADIDIDYLGFEIPDKFVIGYGLDFDGQYRELPDITYIETQEEA